MPGDKADFLAKLQEIEQMAARVHAEMPAGMLRLRTRVQHIVLLAKTLRGRLEIGGLPVASAQPAVPPAHDPKKPPA